MNTTANISKRDIIKIIEELEAKAVSKFYRERNKEPADIKAARLKVERWEEKDSKIRRKQQRIISNLAFKARTHAALGELKPLKAMIEKLRALGEDKEG